MSMGYPRVDVLYHYLSCRHMPEHVYNQMRQTKAFFLTQLREKFATHVDGQNGLRPNREFIFWWSLNYDTLVFLAL